MYYVTDDYKEQVELEIALDPSAEIVSAAGLTLKADGIECYGIYGTVNKIDIGGSSIYIGVGDAIVVDKNHDLPYYFAGSDYMDGRESGTSAINVSNKYGYEWGAAGATTGIQNTDIEAGFSNTNSLIAKSLTPHTSGWYTVWDKIVEFRESYSDQWFLPSKDELNLIYEARANLNNLSLNIYPYYWSSSEFSANSRTNAWGVDFDDGEHNGGSKGGHIYRARLCRLY